MTAIHGPAGTWKTTLMREAVSALETLSGKDVLVLAPSASAVQVLKDDGFVKSGTFQKFISNSTFQALAERQILWVDEAGFLSVKQMNWLIQFADRNGCRLILSGDTRQHHRVERGDALRILQNSGAVRQVVLIRVIDAKGNVDRHNEQFVGRRRELQQLRQIMSLGKVGVLTAIHGLGGIGKTALATEYCYQFAHDYPGGRWQVRCEGKKDLREAFVSLAGVRDLEFEFTEEEKHDLDFQFERVLRELKKRADAVKGRVLIVLDNVDQAKLLEPAQVLVATSLNNLALLYYTQGQYGKAEPLYQLALAILEKAFGVEHPDVATSLNNVASLYKARGQYTKAEALYGRALAIREQALGPKHPDVAQSLNNLGALYRAQGQYAKAEPLYGRALAIREKAFGPEHPEVGQSLNNLALLYYAQGQYAKAEPLYQRALAIWEKALGPEHPDVATYLKSYALLLRNMGRSEEAAPLEDRARAIRAKSA